MDTQEATNDAPIAPDDVTPESIADFVIKQGTKFARRAHRDTKLVDIDPPERGFLGLPIRAKRVVDTDSLVVWKFYDECFADELLELPGDYTEAHARAAYEWYHKGLDRGIELGKLRRDDEIKSMVADLRGLGIGTKIDAE